MFSMEKTTMTPRTVAFLAMFLTTATAAHTYFGARAGTMAQIMPQGAMSTNPDCMRLQEIMRADYTSDPAAFQQLIPELNELQSRCLAATNTTPSGIENSGMPMGGFGYEMPGDDSFDAMKDAPGMDDINPSDFLQTAPVVLDDESMMEEPIHSAPPAPWDNGIPSDAVRIPSWMHQTGVPPQPPVPVDNTIASPPTQPSSVANTPPPVRSSAPIRMMPRDSEVQQLPPHVGVNAEQVRQEERMRAQRVIEELQTKAQEVMTELKMRNDALEQRVAELESQLQIDHAAAPQETQTSSVSMGDDMSAPPCSAVGRFLKSLTFGLLGC